METAKHSFRKSFRNLPSREMEKKKTLDMNINFSTAEVNAFVDDTTNDGKSIMSAGWKSQNVFS